MTDGLEKSNVSKEESAPIHEYVPVIVGVVVAVVGAVLVLLIFYFFMWRKEKKNDAESPLEARPSFNRKISIVGQELNQNWMASNEDSAVLSSVGQSSFPAQFTSDEPSDSVEILMTSVAALENQTNSHLEDIKDGDGDCSPSLVQKQHSFHDSFSSMTMLTQQNEENTNNEGIDATNDSVLFEADCKASKDDLSISETGLANPSPISVKLKQKLIQRKRAQEESNSAAFVSSYSFDENLHYDSKNFDQNVKSDGMSDESNKDGSCGNCDTNYVTSKNPVDNEGNTNNILPIESPDGVSKELDWDSTHEPLKTRSSALKLICTPSQPKPINVTCPNSNLEESTIEEVDVEAANSDDECRKEEIQELDWDSSHEPLKTRKSVLKLVVPQSQ